MLSVFYVFLWQLLALVLSLLVFNHHRTARQLIIPTVIVLQGIQQLISLFPSVGWMQSAYLTTAVFTAQVGGYGYLLIRHLRLYYISFFTKMLVGLQGICIVLMLLLPHTNIPALYQVLLYFNSIAILVPLVCLLYELMKHPPNPFLQNSFPPILWIACGLLFYFLTNGYILVSNSWLPEYTSFPAASGWYTMMRIVQHVVLYIFFTVAFVICLRQPAQTL